MMVASFSFSISSFSVTFDLSLQHLAKPSHMMIRVVFLHRARRGAVGEREKELGRESWKLPYLVQQSRPHPSSHNSSPALLPPRIVSSRSRERRSQNLPLSDRHGPKLRRNSCSRKSRFSSTMTLPHRRTVWPEIITNQAIFRHISLTYDELFLKLTCK